MMRLLEREGNERGDLRRLQRTDLGIVGLLVVCLRLSPTASIHIPDANGTTPRRSPAVLPIIVCLSVLHLC
jgi:hypothetical protein